MSEQKHKIETTLTPRHYQKFLAIKKRLGVESNSSVLNILIAEEYDRIKKEEQARREHNYYLRTHAK